MHATPGSRWSFTVVMAALATAAGASSLPAADPVTIFFDNTGAEAGVTAPGTTAFDFRGSSWSGGVVATERVPPLYASGSFSWEVAPGGSEVVFDPPAAFAEFFYVHGFRFAAGTAAAIGTSGRVLATADSSMATSFGDRANFVRFEAAEPIASIELTSGVVDSFTFLASEAPPPPIEPSDLAIDLEPVASGLTAPVFLTHAGDGSGRLFVLEQPGRIRVIRDGELLERPFLDLTGRTVDPNPTFDERGLLGLAFHPDYARNGRFFVRYSAPREGAPGEPCNDPEGFVVGCHRAVLAEFRVSAADPDVADPASERIVLEVDEPQFNHNAGHLAFGPDGFLYFTLGDGGGRDDGLSSDPPLHGPIGNGQNIDTPLGAIHRIDVDGAEPFEVPGDNPLVSRDGLDSIWAWGLRNPYRFSFDRGGTGELWLGDVGQDRIEEVNVVTAGGNYGWAIREGDQCFDPSDPSHPGAGCSPTDLTGPVALYGHDEGIAVVGGYVYRGTRVPELEGKYLFGDFSREFFVPSGRLLFIDADTADRSRVREPRIGEAGAPLDRFVLGFGEDEEGELYLLASTTPGPLGTSGEVLRITSPASGGGRRVPGDCTEDGNLDLSDAVCLLGFLFLGKPDRLPCAGGGKGEPGNVALLDWQPDGKLDLSDGVASLLFLFAGGPPHPLAVAGTETKGCTLVPGCDDTVPCS